MMPAWHQLVSMSGHVEESETARKLQLYATSIYQVHSFVCQLDYFNIYIPSIYLALSIECLQTNIVGTCHIHLYTTIITNLNTYPCNLIKSKLFLENFVDVCLQMQTHSDNLAWSEHIYIDLTFWTSILLSTIVWVCHQSLEFRCIMLCSCVTTSSATSVFVFDWWPVKMLILLPNIWLK